MNENEKEAIKQNAIDAIIEAIEKFRMNNFFYPFMVDLMNNSHITFFISSSMTAEDIKERLGNKISDVIAEKFSKRTQKFKNCFESDAQYAAECGRDAIQALKADNMYSARNSLLISYEIERMYTSRYKSSKFFTYFFSFNGVTKKYKTASVWSKPLTILEVAIVLDDSDDKI